MMGRWQHPFWLCHNARYLGTALDIFWNLMVSILSVHDNVVDSLMHLPKLISQQSSIPGSCRYLLSDSLGPTEGNEVLWFQDLVLSIPEVGTLTKKRGLNVGWASSVKDNQRLLEIARSFQWFTPDIFHSHHPILDFHRKGTLGTEDSKYLLHKSLS